MANRNRYQRDSQRDQQSGQNFGGSRRDQNMNEFGGNYSGDREFYGGSRTYPQGTSQSNAYGRRQGSSYGQDFSSRNMGQHFGGGSRGNFGNRNFGDDREGRYDVGRDFMTNQPIREGYGEMSDSRFGKNFGRRSSSDYGSGFSYSEPSRDFTERGSYSGSSYGNFGNSNWDRGQGFDSGRTDFDESISGRSYYGQGSSSGNRDYERSGWRGYGARPGNMGFGDRERPDSWDRDAYRGSRLENYGTSSTDQSWRGNRNDYTGAGFYRNDYDRSDRDFSSDRNRYEEESFGDKVKNFFGIGPKGYRRSDERIREDISERLEDHPRIDASNIDVQVSDGEVTLSGTTPDRQSKRLAEDVCEECRGVKDVHNQVRVSQSGDTSSFGTSERSSSVSGSSTSSQTGSSSTTGTTKKSSERAA